VGDAAAERAIIRSIRDGCPDQLLLPFALESRSAVMALIHKRTGRSVSLSMAGRYLRRWGFTPHKPMHRACERDPAVMKRWLKERYPAIRRRAREENALILRGDEMGLRSDDPAGRSYARAAARRTSTSSVESWSLRPAGSSGAT
jgi:hypothetical protein